MQQNQGSNEASRSSAQCPLLQNQVMDLQQLWKSWVSALGSQSEVVLAGLGNPVVKGQDIIPAQVNRIQKEKFLIEADN